MCLGAPGQVVRFIDAKVVLCDFWGTRREVRVDELDEAIAIGDYLLEHEGSAVRRIREEQVADTLLMYELVLADA